MISPDEMRRAGQLALPDDDTVPVADDGRGHGLEYFPLDLPPTPSLALGDSSRAGRGDGRRRGRAETALAGWWLTSRTLAWRFDTRMAEYEYQIEEAWARHVIRHLPSSEDREVAWLAARVRLWQLRQGSLKLCQRFDTRMAIWEERIEEEARDLGRWTKLGLATAWTRQVGLMRQADARTRSAASGLLRRAAARRPVRGAASTSPSTLWSGKRRGARAQAQAQARHEGEIAPARQARSARDARARVRTRARVSEPAEPAEVSPAPGLRERALDALQLAQAEQAARQRRRQLEEAWVLRQLLHERLGVRVNPESRRVKVDDLQFAVRWNKAAATYDLVLMTTCGECGAPAVSDDIASLANLGVLVSGRPDAQPRCPTCRAKAHPARTMTASERLAQDIRELVAEEVRHQQEQAHAIDQPTLAWSEREPLPARREAYRRLS